jgi:DMSO/TMAO reductase YedYZ molybdopterin-dependent catalytic subunit
LREIAPQLPLDEEDGPLVFAHACKLGLEGIVSKRRDSPYNSQVRCNGMDEAIVPDAPDFMKSLDTDHARDGEVMLAYAMNGQQLPLLNGFPLRLIVPGWYSTYWVKMLNDIEVLDQPDSNYWTTTACRIPDTPHANVEPGQTGVKSMPISRMVPRSFITNIKAGGYAALRRPPHTRARHCIRR